MIEKDKQRKDSEMAAVLEVIEKKREELRAAMRLQEKSLEASGNNAHVHNAVWDGNKAVLKKLTALTELETLLSVEKKLDYLLTRGFESLPVKLSHSLTSSRIRRLKRQVGID